MEIILASGSPQRREMLERLGVEFEAIASGSEEIVHGDPGEVVSANALLKARSVARPGALTIGADTDVVLEGSLLGKPGDEVRAREYLAQLSGREHAVLSGLAVIGPEPDQVGTALVETRVVFRDLSPGIIERYLASGEWRDRAGGYAIQGIGSSLVASVEGDVSNVIGLPVGALLELVPSLTE
jgi:septum formation protein